jgi:hypothetical protein
MDSYYVNNHAQTNGDHEVHTSSCSFLPTDRKYLGSFGNCREAVQEAKKTYRQSNGCYFCCKACHTS